MLRCIHVVALAIFAVLLTMARGQNKAGQQLRGSSISSNSSTNTSTLDLSIDDKQSADVCMDTPDWNNGWKSCNEEGMGSDPSKCIPHQGWTCAAYVAKGWCQKKRCLPVSETGGVHACGHTLNSPEWNCCACGKPQLPPASSPCCERCTVGVPGFCSPISGNCYSTRAKDYYEGCPAGGLEPAPLPRAVTTNGSIKVMSYNLMGWNTFKTNTWRSLNVLNKVKAWDPSILGAQEVEKGGGQGYDDVKDAVVNSTGLGHAGGSQFYNASVVEKGETEWLHLMNGHWADYWMSMTKYKHKASGNSFLFFNSHWKHGYGMDQAQRIATKIHEQREKYGSPPTLLVGDTNQFCIGHDKDAIRYLKGENGLSPVVFVDATFLDKGMSFDGGCRVDFILASINQWSWVQSSIDRKGMGSHGNASDHAALMAELVPLF